MLKTPFVAAGIAAGLILSAPLLSSTASAMSAGCGAACPGGGSPSSEQPGGPGGGTGGDGGDLPVLSPDEQIAKMTEICNAALNDLVKIPPSMVAAFASEG